MERIKQLFSFDELQLAINCCSICMKIYSRDIEFVAQVRYVKNRLVELQNLLYN